MELKPRIGIDNIKFGMTKNEVIGILGEPDRVLDEDYGVDDEYEELLEWNNKKVRLTFKQNENYRLTYIRTKNNDLNYKGKPILNETPEFIKQEVFSEISKTWKIDDYDFFHVHFDDKNWLSISTEYGTVCEFEFGVPFKNDDEYEWP